MGACICGRIRLKHRWKGYKDKGQTWDCWQMDKGLLDMQPIPPTLQLLQIHAVPKWVCLDFQYLTGLHMASTILLLLQSQNNATVWDQHIGACTTPKHTQTSWFKPKLEQTLITAKDQWILHHSAFPNRPSSGTLPSMQVLGCPLCIRL